MRLPSPRYAPRRVREPPLGGGRKTVFRISRATPSASAGRNPILEAISRSAGRNRSWNTSHAPATLSSHAIAETVGDGHARGS